MRAMHDETYLKNIFSTAHSNSDGCTRRNVISVIQKLESIETFRFGIVELRK